MTSKAEADKTIREHDRRCVRSTESAENKTSEKTQTTVGQRLQKIRKELKLSPKVFADKLGLASEDAITIFESDACLPTGPTLLKMAERFNIDIHELLTGQPSPQIAEEVGVLRELKHRFRRLLAEIQPTFQTLKATKKYVEHAHKKLQMTIEFYEYTKEKK